MADEGACIYGASVLQKHLHALEAESTAVHAGAADIEYIHRARVASRRLRATLPLFASCFSMKDQRAWIKRIRRVTRSLGAARDLDVQIACVRAFLESSLPKDHQSGARRLLLRLWQQRQKRQKPVTRAMQKLLASGAIDDLHRRLEAISARQDAVYPYTPALYRQSEQAISERLDQLLQYHQVVDQPENVLELHAMRIAAKRLRYTMEAFAPLYGDKLSPFLSAVRAIQEQLGTIHDCDVWAAFLPAFLERERRRVIAYTGFERPYFALVPGIEAFQADRRRARTAAYQDFHSQWMQWQAQKLWEALRMALQTPFPPADRFFPPLE